MERTIRKVLRKVCLLCGVSAVSLVFQACYGTPLAPCMPPCGEKDCEWCVIPPNDVPAPEDAE